MSRARNIKPSFFKNEDLADLDPLARILFIGLWTEADYKGCLEYRPRRLKIEILPYDECDIEELMINLERSGFIAIYTVAGQQYAKVLKFEEHQNPHKNEREKGSPIPDISEAENDSSEKPIINNGLENIENNRDKNGTTPEPNGSAPADSLFLIPDSLNPINTFTNVKGDESPDIELTEAELWKAGKSLLEEFGMAKGQTGSFIGQLVKDHGRECALASVGVAVKTRPPDPASYMVGVCRRNAPHVNQSKKRQSVSDKNYSYGVKADGTSEF